MAELKERMTMAEFWGWIGFLKLRAVPIEVQRQRAVSMLQLFAKHHNANVKAK